ncbi:lipopolysaccharide biosynthesis protein [Clostridium perfringens]|uniref:lipopolysaccharide biosynthesis protein n=1 Tax=Clostridium perfringens TaxID=1502 RepID=UPI0024BC2AC4|nr:oligosaccharide flippase family protein [Clostridium perfringens]
MKSKYKSLTKNTFIIGVGNIGSSMISFLLIPLFTNYLTAAEYGQIDFTMIIITLLVPVFTLNFTEVIIRFGLDNKYNIKEVISTVMISVMMIFITNLSLIGVLKVIGINIDKYFVLSILIFLNSIYELLKYYARAIEKINFFALGDIIYTISFCLLNMVLLILLKLGIGGYFIAYSLSNFIYIIFIGISCGLYKDLQIRYYNKKYFKEFFKYSLPLIPNSISNWIINVSDRFMIKIFVDYSSLGIYSIANKITQIINTFYSLFFKAWQISSIKELNKEDTEEFYSQIFKVLIKVMFGISILLLTFINIIFYIFIGKGFENAIYYLPILVLSVIFYTLSSFLGTIYTAYKKSKEIFKSTMIVAVLNILINAIFMAKFGAIIACISTLISYAFLFIYRYFDSKKFMNIYLDKKEFFSYLIIIIASIINIYFCGLSYENMLIGTVLLITYILLNRDDLVNIVKILRREINGRKTNKN